VDLQGAYQQVAAVRQDNRSGLQLDALLTRNSVAFAISPGCPNRPIGVMSFQIGNHAGLLTPLAVIQHFLREVVRNAG
jgi:hypothetical protein